MYRTLRDIHLCVAMFLFAFLMAYATSAVDFAHRKWLPHSRKTTEEVRHFPPGITDARVLARNWRGELDRIENAAGYLRFRVGNSVEVAYSIATGETKVRTTSVGIFSRLNRIHTSRGVWAYVVILFSVGLLTLGATGLYLWFKNHNERAVGVVMLVLGAAISLLLTVSIRAS
jgi:hypothetical protein